MAPSTNLTIISKPLLGGTERDVYSNMRHIPTSLYIDTEVFVRNGYRFDTEAFTRMLDTFVKGGIRLLIPEMMERGVAS